MRVNKRSGDSEPVDLNKIVRAVQRCAEGLHPVDPMRVATRTISGLYDGASTRELDELSIRTAALLTAAEIGRAHVCTPSLMRSSYAVFCLKKNNITSLIRYTIS